MTLTASRSRATSPRSAIRTRPQRESSRREPALGSPAGHANGQTPLGPECVPRIDCRRQRRPRRLLPRCPRSPLVDVGGRLYGHRHLDHHPRQGPPMSDKQAFISELALQESDGSDPTSHTIGTALGWDFSRTSRTLEGLESSGLVKTTLAARRSGDTHLDDWVNFTAEGKALVQALEHDGNDRIAAVDHAERWSRIDMPVLLELARGTESDEGVARIDDIARRHGLRTRDVLTSFDTLKRTGFVDARLDPDSGGEYSFIRLSDKGLQTTGLWPTPETGALPHDRRPLCHVPARRNVAGATGGRLQSGPVLRPHPPAVRLPASPLVHMVRDESARPAGGSPACPRRAVHPPSRRDRSAGLLDQHDDARGPRVLPVRPHRRPHPGCPAVYARVPKIHQDESRTQALDRLELIRFLQVAQNITVHHGALAYLLGINALRASEAAAVRIEDYRKTLRGHRVLHLVGKGNKPATMPLTVPVLRVLEACRGQRTDGPLVPRPVSGQADRPAGLLPDGRPDREGRRHSSPHQPHSLRHTAITNALDAGVPLRDAQILARHADPRPPSTMTAPAATSTATASTSSPSTSQGSEQPGAVACSAVRLHVMGLHEGRRFRGLKVEAALAELASFICFS
jgi:hypothetical protein